MDQLSQQDLQSVDYRLGPDFIFDHRKSVELRSAKGGTVGAPPILHQLCERLHDTERGRANQAY